MIRFARCDVGGGQDQQACGFPGVRAAPAKIGGQDRGCLTIAFVDLGGYRLFGTRLEQQCTHARQLTAAVEKGKQALPCPDRARAFVGGFCQDPREQ